ncbi:MAG: radical SAM protein [Thermoproteus sp. AZ2]|uniref:Radical SAM protein n=1 Tax=Thermoproteus sp. AZ2 TaxID=1609232 RepID=A0ACC6V061_9CREN
MEPPRKVYRVGAPMIGTRYFGIVDQGTNIVEVRPTSLCPLNCIFCSVAAGPLERRRWADFIADREELAEALRAVAKLKGPGLEVHIDGMGEPAVYPELVELVSDIRGIKEVEAISMQTRLFMLSEEKIRELAEAGLDRINLSLDALEPALAKRLAGASYYDPARAAALAEFAVRNTRMDVLVSPVWLPGLNDGELPKIAKWAVEAGLGKRWPPVLIQKYLPHKRGRRPDGVRPVEWPEFWRWLRRLEKELGIRLDWRGENPFRVERRPAVPKPHRAGERVKARVIARGVFKGEYLAVPLKLSGDPLLDRSITVTSDKRLREGDEVVARIIEDEDNVYIARAELVFPQSA